jgi:hypothetical protein
VGSSIGHNIQNIVCLGNSKFRALSLNQTTFNAMPYWNPNGSVEMRCFLVKGVCFSQKSRAPA